MTRSRNTPSRKVAVSVGHFPDRQGAESDGWTEYALCAMIVGATVRHLTRMGHAAWLVPGGKLTEKVVWVNQRGFDLAIEVHGNAGGGSGCEVLYCPGSERGKEYAGMIQRAIVPALGVRNRGTKEGRGQGGSVFYWLKETDCPAVIVEPDFLDSEEGLKHLQYKAERIGRAIAESL